MTESTKAPDFTMPASNGRTVSLAGQRGKPFVLYFYPKADTPGCTREACAFEESLPDFKDIAVIGVSPDAMPAIEKFAKKYTLTFPLAADPDHKTAEAFGVWVEKMNYGKTYMGTARTTFVIDEQGIILDIISKVDTKNHTEQILS